MEKKFTMSLPREEEIRKEVETKTAVSAQRNEALAAAGAAQAQAILNIDINNAAERGEVMKTIEAFGAESIVAGKRKNEFLAKRIASFQKNSDETGAVATGLTELSVQMKNLDPTGIRFSEGAKSRLFNPVRKYFARYEKADTVIDGIVEAISNGEKQLKNDNQTLLIEQLALEEETRRLGEYIAMGKEFDSALSAMLEKARMEGADETRIAFFESEVLFPLRQKVMDMGTLLAVNYQGIGAIDIIRKNNLELIRGVQRARQVSVAALRIGVMCAQALYNQNLVLKAVQTLSQSTSAIIEANANMLKSQSGEIMEMAANPMIAVDTLKASFDTVFAVLDECESYKRTALPQMAQAIETFTQIGEEGAVRLQQITEAREQRSALQAAQ